MRPHPPWGLREAEGMLHLNDGDRVESRTALVEHHDGSLELIDRAALSRLSLFVFRQPGLPQAFPQAVG
jgi:hypothetical protein